MGPSPARSTPPPSFGFPPGFLTTRNLTRLNCLFYLVYPFNNYLLNTGNALTPVFQGLHQCLAKQKTTHAPWGSGAQTVIREDENS